MNLKKNQAENLLLTAVLKWQHHLDALKKLRDDCEPCEREKDPGYHPVTGEELSPGRSPCWTQKLEAPIYDEEGRCIAGAITAEERIVERAELVAEHYCQSCQRNEVKIRAWYVGRRKTGALRAAVTRIARRMLRATESCSDCAGAGQVVTHTDPMTVRETCETCGGSGAASGEEAEP